MITHVVTLKTLFPPKPAEQADVAALEERLDAALSRYCGGDAVAEDACRKWLAFERGILADSSIAPASLLVLADAIDEAKPEGCHLSSKASAFLTFRLLGLSSLPPVRAAVPQEGLPSLIEPPENARWACGLLPFSPRVRFAFRPGAPWLRGLMEKLEQTAGAAPGSGWGKAQGTLVPPSRRLRRRPRPFLRVSPLGEQPENANASRLGAVVLGARSARTSKC